MQRNKGVTSAGAITNALALMTILVVSTAPAALAATPDPLPPPPEVLDGSGFGYGGSVNLQYGQGQFNQGRQFNPGQPVNNQFNPYGNNPYANQYDPYGQQYGQQHGQYGEPQFGNQSGGQYGVQQGVGQQSFAPPPQQPAWPLPQPRPPQPAPQPMPPRNDVYDPYNTPVSSYLPPLPGQPSAEIGIPYQTPTPWLPQPAGPAGQPVPAFPVPNLNAPPMAGSPGDPRAFSNRPPSPPAAFMPDDYFNLPLPIMAPASIPGVLLPELNEEFHDPGMRMAAPRRPVRPGMTERQLEPFFDLAKGFEKSALTAKELNDGRRYQDDLKKAIDGYMEIIAMADAGHEAREEAWYGVARCEYRRENWWKAFDAIERSFPGKFDRPEVEGRIKLEMFIAERLWRLGHAPAPDALKDGRNLTGYQAASRVYAAAIFNQPNAKEAPLALLRRGDAAAMDGDWKEAAKFYRTVVQYYPESEPAMQARSSLAEAVYRQEWPAGFPEAARTDLASVMTEVESTERRLSGPAEERRQRAATLANSHEAEIKLRQAKDYMGKIRVRKSRDAAVFQLGEIVSHYPNTPQAREAADILLSMGIEPPLVLSDGSRYPIPSGGASMLERVANQTGTGAGSVGVSRQNDIRGGLPEPAPVREQPGERNMPIRERVPEPPRQGNFSPVPDTSLAAPQSVWPSPRINVPPRPRYWGQEPAGVYPQQAGLQPSLAQLPPPGFQPAPFPGAVRQGIDPYRAHGAYVPTGQGMPGYEAQPQPDLRFPVQRSAYNRHWPQPGTVPPPQPGRAPVYQPPAPFQQVPPVGQPAPVPEPRPEPVNQPAGDVHIPGISNYNE